MMLLPHPKQIRQPSCAPHREPPLGSESGAGTVLSLQPAARAKAVKKSGSQAVWVPFLEEHLWSLVNNVSGSVSSSEDNADDSLGQKVKYLRLWQSWPSGERL